MTSSALILGLAGVFALFAPDALLYTQGSAPTGTASVLVQLMGALYFSFALMNWTAKDSRIGGIYARPVSLGNFSHFFAGTLLMKLVVKRASVSWKAAILGMVALYVLGLIPGIGFLVGFALSAAALGTMTMLFYRFTLGRNEIG